MVEPELRKSLSQDVRRLVTGRMTNNAFDDVYYELYESSGDRAVTEIASSCYCLYSSDLPLPYRLRGRYAVDDEVRSTAARSVLFLRSGLEYEWPPMPDNPGLRCLAGIALFGGIPGGIALLLISVPALFLTPIDDMICGLAVLGIILLIGSSLLTLFWPRLLAKDWDSFRQSGEYDVWPFIRRRDFELARRQCHLFRK
jgi:hypothetical protein